MNIDEIGLKVKMLIKKIGTLKMHQVKEMNNIFNEIKLLSTARNKLIQSKLIQSLVIANTNGYIDIATDVIDDKVIAKPINKPIERLIKYCEIPDQHIKMVVKKN
jgi:hypothetical protein|tara:strand:- start:3779 stop:4093 length:315 start_codon:yes stop_codon:yes gene_type:complete